MNPIRDTSLKGKGPALSKHGLPPQRDCLLLTLALQKATANPACGGTNVAYVVLQYKNNPARGG